MKHDLRKAVRATLAEKSVSYVVNVLAHEVERVAAISTSPRRAHDLTMVAQALRKVNDEVTT